MSTIHLKLFNKFSYQWLHYKSLSLPIDKTSLLLLYLVINYSIVFIDVAIAHAFNMFYPAYEWIPVTFGPLATISTLIILIFPRPGWIKLVNYFINALGILIGIIGFGFHLQGAAAGNAVSFAGLSNANPVFAPLAFAALGLIGIISITDDSPDSRKYGFTNKTRWLFHTTAFWFIATALVAFFDHARTNFSNAYTWIPFFMGVFAAVILILQSYSKAESCLTWLFVITMFLSVIVGLLGFAFHLSVDLAGRGVFVWSRVFYHAPGLAPLLFCDLGIWGLIVAIDPLPNKPV